MTFEDGRVAMSDSHRVGRHLGTADFLAGGGEMGRRIREFEWSATPLGVIEHWSQSLRSALSICLNSNFPIAIYWGSDLVLFYNDEWNSIAGANQTSVLGRPVREVWPKVWHIIEPLCERVLTTGEATRSRDLLLPMYQHSRTEGCDFEYTFSPIRGHTGQIEGVFSAAFNTTSRVKQAEDALRASEERFARFMQHLPGLAWVKDRDGRYVFANDAAVIAFGMPREGLYGKTDQEVFSPDTARQFRANDRHALAGASGVRTIETLEDGDGVVRHSLVSKFPIPGPSGEPPLVGGVAIDITEEMRTRAVLEESEARFRATFDQAAVGIAHVGTDGRWLRVNRKLCDIVGYSPDELLQLTFQDITHPDDVGADLVQLRRLLAGEVNTYSLEKRYFHKDRRTVWINLTVALARTSQGEPNYLISVVEDITEKKAVEDSLRDSERKYRTLFENMAEEVHYWRVDRDDTGRIVTWRLVDANPPALRTWGKSLDAIRGQTTDEIFGPGSTEHYRAVVEQVMAGGVPYAYEDYFPALDRHFRFTTVPVGDHFITTGADITAIQKAHESIRRSEDRYRTVLESITDAFFAVGRDWRFTYVNRQAEMLLGRTPGELPGRNLWDEYPGLVGSEFERAYRRVMAERVTESVTAFYPDHQRWYEVDVFPADGGISVYFRDVSDRVRADEALRASEERYRTLFESMDEGYCIIEVIFDPPGSGRAVDYRFIEVNPAFEAQAGMRGVVGRRMLEFVPSIESHWLENYGRVALTGSPIRFADEYTGLNRWFEVYAFRVGPADGHRVAVLFTDITARMRAEAERVRLLAELEAKTAFIQAVIRQVPVGILVAEAGTGRLLLSNDEAERISGVRYEAGVPVSENDDRFPMQGFRPDGRRYGSDDWPLTRALQGETVQGEEIELLRGDGSRLTIRVNATPIHDPAGAVAAAVAAFHDVTPEKQAGQALRDADRRKDEFLATLAHELRNPLAPIRNGLQIMRLSNGEREVVEEARAMMERQLSQMVHLVDDLLDLSRVSRGKIDLRKERVDLGRVVQQAVETSRPQIEANGHYLTITMPPGPIYVDADVTRLAQVLSNLLNNAAKYTERGGRVELSVLRQGGEVAVSVRDNGIGIPANMLPRVFEMFTQVDRHLARSQGGLGIGLSIVKKLVEMHGGSVAVESGGQDTGSQFTVRLPLALSVAEPTVDDEKLTLPSRRRRILVVDDNKDAAISLALVLKLMGNEAKMAHDGLEALDVAAAYQPDLILLDIGMPRLNGYETAKRIRQQPWGKSIVLVALTGWGQDEDRRKSHEAGFDSHMVKPIEPAALEMLLANMATRMA